MSTRNCWADLSENDKHPLLSKDGSCYRPRTTSLGLCDACYTEITGKDPMLDPLKYLTEVRGIDPAIAEFADWRREGDEYVIPYFDAFGRERTHRYHRPDGKPKYRTISGDKPHLYCVENVRYSQVILCEGEIDTLSALSAGLKAVGVAGANSFYRPWIHLIEHVDDLVIAFDGDDAGRQAAAKLKSAIPQARVVDLPDGKDLNDILRGAGAGAQALRALLTKEPE